MVFKGRLCLHPAEPLGSPRGGAVCQRGELWVLSAYVQVDQFGVVTRKLTNSPNSKGGRLRL